MSFASQNISVGLVSRPEDGSSLNAPVVEGAHTATTTAAYPALSELRLSTEDFVALRANGFVSPERRGQSIVYKLRFRGGRQMVRYIGDAARAAAVGAELAELQAPTRALQALTKLSKEAARRIRSESQILKPALQASGFKFHGRAIRRPHRLTSARTLSTGFKEES